MKNGKKFVDKLLNNVDKSMNTSALAEVISYSNGYADIKLKDGGDLIQSVPVSAQHFGEWLVSVELSKGDTVAVVFSQHEIDGVLEGTGVATNRRKDINDAIIVGAVRTNRTAPVASKGIYIGDLSGNRQISLTKDAVSLKNGQSSITLVADKITIRSLQIELAGETERTVIK